MEESNEQLERDRRNVQRLAAENAVHRAEHPFAVPCVWRGCGLLCILTHPGATAARPPVQDAGLDALGDRTVAQALVGESREAAAVRQQPGTALPGTALPQLSLIRPAGLSPAATLASPPPGCPRAQEHAEDAGDASQVKGDTLTDRHVLEGTAEGPPTSV